MNYDKTLRQYLIASNLLTLNNSRLITFKSQDALCFKEKVLSVTDV